MKNVNNIADMLPLRGYTNAESLPKGKPKRRVVTTNGCFRQITYFFGRAVYVRNIFKGEEKLILLNRTIVNSKGEFLK